MGDTGTMSIWGTEFPQMLASHFRVTLFDNRGVGYSTDDVLITNGSEDVVVPPRNADVIVERVGTDRAKKLIFDGAGHGMWFQDMDRFVELVVDFLRPARR